MLKTMAPMLALAVCVGPVEAQAPGRVSAKWIGGVQVQVNTTDVGGQPGSRFELRRMRIGAELDVQDWIDGKVDMDVAGGAVVLKDVWVDLALAPAFAIRAGRLKKPFSVIQLTGYSQLVTVERGVRIRGLPGGPVEEFDLLSESGYLGWDVGVAAHGALSRTLSYTAGVFNGGDAARGPGAFAARLSCAPLADRPLQVSAAVSRATVPGTEGTAWEADVAWGSLRRPGLRLLAEAMLADNLAPAGGGTPTMRGAQAAAAWFLPARGSRLEGVELEGRVSYGDPDAAVAGDGGWLLTPGAALYFFERNRVQVNWDVYVPRGASGRHSAFVVQLQLIQ